MQYRFIQLLKNTILFLVLTITSCQAQTSTKQSTKTPILGAEQIENYLPLISGKNLAIVGNQTSVIPHKNGYTHLVDTLLSYNQNILKVFAPEHGFRGQADAGEKVKNSRDAQTGLPIISLYGNHKKPTPEDLADVDMVIFDIQDVGARFYTYISTLHYVMEACAEQDIPLLILDRPNPNGHYIDGPILEDQFKSFVGMHPVPVVHGLSIGEYAQMINGEAWLNNGVKTKLQIIKLKHYNKAEAYKLPIKPSPNLPNAKAINLYPSLCFFEGTTVNAGRGTNFQFQIYGSPFLNQQVYSFSYTPQPNEGAKHPKHKAKLCYGEDLRTSAALTELNLNWLIKTYKNTKNQDDFFNSFFNKLAGNSSLQKQIKAGKSAGEIKKSWQTDLKTYQQMIMPYLLYE
ncbi:Uncharacterized conserved protein YbbC, DUF1343 family [Psychroflexus salarius]|uniref:Uncharacterized conserved protein YbbC, DUF1343 family n=1 Tax=Psychroflexus salarius TaxID=1155689 RepID=A0A1M4TU28_9FLAO|nr:DUF1343 domain-containing protein [Psychroflexus salarius]SHE47928.1 Uncharacterized conserved protein YbbC, DUF1343 family [Psychroflexus salarius]